LLLEGALLGALAHGSCAHDFQHPLLKGVITARLIREETKGFSTCVRGGSSKRGIRLHLKLISQLTILLPIYLNDFYLLRPIPVFHVIDKFIEIVQNIVAPGTVFHVKINENEFVLGFPVY